MSDKETMQENKGLGFFEKYLTVWVAVCIIVGVAIGQLVPSIPETLSKFEYANVSIPVAILIWLMIYPMMLKIDFSSIVRATKKTEGTYSNLYNKLAYQAFYNVSYCSVFLESSVQ